MANGAILKIDTQDNLDERLRKKLNTNFDAIKDAVSKVWKIATDPYYHFDVIYPVGCLVWTCDEDDPRFRRGVWSLRNDLSFEQYSRVDSSDGSTTTETYKGLARYTKVTERIDDGFGNITEKVTETVGVEKPSKSMSCYERTE